MSEKRKTAVPGVARHCPASDRLVCCNTTDIAAAPGDEDTQAVLGDLRVFYQNRYRPRIGMITLFTRLFAESVVEAHP